MSSRLGWWEVLVFTHRWLGIAACLLFLLWFVSGIAMMHVRMPELTADERFAHLPVLDASAINVSVSDAARAVGASTASAELAMLGTRPVYRFRDAIPSTVFADTALPIETLSEEDTMAPARLFAPDRAETLRYVGLVSTPDQWTLQSRAHLPLHHIAFDDEAGTEICIATKSGEVVMETTTRERLWAYVGPVAHWLYLPVLRRNGPLWTQVIIWSSIASCVLCLLGLGAGVVRFSPRRRFPMRGVRPMSSYVGWLKWHHYAGLLFGVITLTWTFSGLLSMGPFPLLSSGGLTADQRRALVGNPSRSDALEARAVRDAVTSAHSALRPKELALVQFRGQAYWLASESPSRHVLIDATHPERQPCGDDCCSMRCGFVAEIARVCR